MEAIFGPGILMENSQLNQLLRVKSRLGPNMEFKNP